MGAGGTAERVVRPPRNKLLRSDHGPQFEEDVLRAGDAGRSGGTCGMEGAVESVGDRLSAARPASGAAAAEPRSGLFDRGQVDPRDNEGPRSSDLSRSGDLRGKHA